MQWLCCFTKIFCDAFLIENEIIEGRARTGKKDINISRSNYFSDHAWNAVKVNNQWRLVDPTWSAGYLDDTNGNRPKFVKEYNDEYYFTAPEKLILNHFPKNDQFQFFEKKIDFKEFSKWPLYSSAFIKDSISNVVPNMALLKLSQGDTLTIKFQSPSMMTNICVTSEVKKAEYNGFSEYKDGWYEFHYPVTVIGFYNLHIGYCLAGNRFSLLSYKLQVDQKR
jgi:transglutaminase/protease-like cytokinesis protein 3